MWWSYQLTGMFMGITENIIDKKYIIDSNIDNVQSSLIRLVIYTLLAVLVSFVLGHHFEVLVYTGIIVLGFLGAISSIMYSNIVRNQDISIIAVLPLVMPIIFFFLDHYILHSSFTLIGGLSLILSIVGAYLFMQNRGSINRTAVINLSIMAIYGASEFYYLKDLHIDPLLFFSNICLYSSIFVFLYLAITKNLFRFERKYIEYTKGMIIAKSFDLMGSIMFGYAALNATGVKVATFELLSAPLALLVTYLLIKIDFLAGEFLTVSRRILFGLSLMLTGEYLMLAF